VNGGTAFTDQLDIKLERRRLDPFGPMPQKRNILMTGTRIQSVAYDQIRSDPLQATYLQVPLIGNVFRYVSVVDAVAAIKVSKLESSVVAMMMLSVQFTSPPGEEGHVLGGLGSLNASLIPMTCLF
jgi:hypothetical protein